MTRVRRRLGRAAGLDPVLSLREEYLGPIGWIRSRLEGASVDAAGDPLPWITYGAIALLTDRVRPDMRVFEYGSGNSTRWWAARVERVVACEHDPDWFERVRKDVPANVEMLHRSLDPEDGYATAVRDVAGPFDVVVIDGRQRNRCADAACAALSSSGVILWDNTERDEYAPGIALLRERGFRRIDFPGLGPINAYGSQTTVFYRPGNCFDL